MSFAFDISPQYRLALILLGVLGITVLSLLLWYCEKRLSRRLFVFAEKKLAARLVNVSGSLSRRITGLLYILGIVSVLIALAQPRWGETKVELQAGTREFLVLLDTSESMRSDDILPTRLERAKLEIESLLQQFPADAFGLIVFSGAASITCPVTVDHAYFRSVLNAIDTGYISAKGTDIGSALREALHLLEEEKKQRPDFDDKTRTVILISDGENTSDNSFDVAERVAEYAHIFVVGIGTPEGGAITRSRWSIPGRQEKTLEETHITRLDEETLMRIATAGKGAYVRSQPDNSDIKQITEVLSSIHTQSRLSEHRFELAHRFQWFLAFALLCFATDALVSSQMPKLWNSFVIRRRVGRMTP